MLDMDFKKAVDSAIAQQPEKRVLPFTYEGRNYFIKRRISNHRNAFAKQSVNAAFWCEVYKILTVNQYAPLAPELVLLDEEYFVMKAVGKTMQGVAKEAPWADCRRHAFHKAGEALARLHSFGLHHGRPALRDIAYDRDRDKITFLDWENERLFIKAAPPVIDFFLFVHSCFRERWGRESTELLDEAMKGYLASPMGREICRQAQQMVERYHRAFHITHKLRIFQWTDVTSLDAAREYIQKLQV